MLSGFESSCWSSLLSCVASPPGRRHLWSSWYEELALMMINKALNKTTFMKSKSEWYSAWLFKTVALIISSFTLTLLQQCTPRAVLPLAGPVWSWTTLWETASWGQPRPLCELWRKQTRTHESVTCFRHSWHNTRQTGITSSADSWGGARTHHS